VNVTTHRIVQLLGTYSHYEKVTLVIPKMIPMEKDLIKEELNSAVKFVQGGISSY
jgi:hypothetical protein